MRAGLSLLLLVAAVLVLHCQVEAADREHPSRGATKVTTSHVGRQLLAKEYDEDDDADPDEANEGQQRIDGDNGQHRPGQPSGKTPPRGSNIPGLYDDETSYIAMLTQDNLDPTLASSVGMWVVEFYASWCGTCINYADDWRLIARQLGGWQPYLHVGAINCGDDANQEVCTRHGIDGYPRIKVFPPHARHDQGQEIDHRHIYVVLRDVFSFIASNLPRQMVAQLSSPSAEEIQDVLHPDSVVAELPRLILISRKSSLQTASEEEGGARQRGSLQLAADCAPIILDIFTATRGIKLSMEVLWVKDSEELGQLVASADVKASNLVAIITHPDFDQPKLVTTDVPLPLPNTDPRPIFGDTIPVPLQDARQDVLNSLGLSRPKIESYHLETHISQNASDFQHEFRHVHIVDLVAAINYALRSEVARHQVIEGEELAALLAMVKALIKYLNFYPTLTSSLNEYLHFLEKHVPSVSSTDLMAFTAAWKARLPSWRREQPTEYVQCKGSTPYLRGYPCGLWSIFHTLTARAADAGDAKAARDIFGVIQDYVRVFFGCRGCAEHFLRVADEANERIKDGDPDSPMLFLWRAHNLANVRLGNDASEKSTDPLFPKVLFPTERQCGACRLPNQPVDADQGWDLKAVAEYLKDFYVTPLGFKPRRKQPTAIEQAPPSRVEADRDDEKRLRQKLERDSRKVIDQALDGHAAQHRFSRQHGQASFGILGWAALLALVALSVYVVWVWRNRRRVFKSEKALV